eukprot:TRINITY_DN1127_c1_g1_i2.p1 TRINITY_DN1127_c1_g1~~TRINITY_DN1127_c1_g1_i2.p1  ORF type:complete len:137 (+),score=10.89 TRINITY_DN1127_c1_g1_i2:240-650(+)
MARMFDLRCFLIACSFFAVASETQRYAYRKTVDGNLCSTSFSYNEQTFEGCTVAKNPEGSSGREWCMLENQLENAGVGRWAFCAPQADYNSARQRISRTYIERASEFSSLAEVMTDLAKRVVIATGKVSSACKSSA